MPGSRTAPDRQGLAQERGACPVHPRACGERDWRRRFSRRSSGSSPRVRGTPRALGPDRPLKRFIPARAGNANWWAIASFSTILILLGLIAIVTLALVFSQMKLRLAGGAKRSRNGARRAI